MQLAGVREPWRLLGIYDTSGCTVNHWGGFHHRIVAPSLSRPVQDVRFRVLGVSWVFSLGVRKVL